MDQREIQEFFEAGGIAVEPVSYVLFMRTLERAKDGDLEAVAALHDASERFMAESQAFTRSFVNPGPPPDSPKG